ncbi:tetratricopeptide repeat protein [Azospirillum doebereinerae]|uniref:Toll/interleukin-1 receptor domain-containing protein n=1 Tax=Azospirillum doebereinerae TaxID=92933 RepID=A0A433J174_9PROT|nr:toll/interleukin-1 receptor domain-containing protein [Azospirillum doebereinerae]RUQ63943.1 toll/interleukin-1 receptor domain-containing protein [Azospirillum doebereinerae]
MTYDVFISYPQLDKAAVHPLRDALEAAGLSVWIDVARIEDGASITRNIVLGMGESRMVLAWYSPAYAASRACQWELTAAFLTGQREGDETRRLMVVNSEPSPAHIQPEALRDSMYLQANLPIPDLVERVRQRLARAPETPMGGVRPLSPPEWVGPKRLGSNRFVGRLPELWSVHSRLTASGIGVISGVQPGRDLVRVHGMGGIGKSLLAEEYALRFGSAYPGGIVWLTASKGDTETADATSRRDRQFQAVASALGLEMAGHDPAAVVRLVGRHLAGREPYLWVVDDLPADADLAELQLWQAPGANGRSLFTTRNRSLDFVGGGVSLDVLGRADALRLLTARRPPANAGETATAEAIVGELGGHALAVDVAAAAVRSVGYGAFLNRLRKPGPDALHLAAKWVNDLPTGHEASIATTLLQSLDRLSPAGLTLLHLTSLMAPDPIPKDFLAAILANPEEPDDDGLDALAQGIRAAEAEALAECGDDNVTVHVLVSRTLRFHKPAPDDWRKAAVKVLLRYLPLAGDIGQHHQLLPLIPHARSLTTNLPDADSADAIGWLARFDYQRGAYNGAEAGYRWELNARTVIQGEEHPDTLTSMNNLALTLGALGNAAGAKAMHERVLAVRIRVQGEEHPDTLTSMNNLAATLGALGNAAGAKAMHERILAARIQVLGEEHPDTLTSMNNLAATLKALGDTAGAKVMHERVLAVQSRVLGEEHPDTLTSMNNLASTLEALDDAAGAKAMHERELAVCHRVLGEEHPDTLISMNNLAWTAFELGGYDEARKLWTQAKPVALRLFGVDHKLTRVITAGLDRLADNQETS